MCVQRWVEGQSPAATRGKATASPVQMKLTLMRANEIRSNAKVSE
jgi:hypothetical protein